MLRKVTALSAITLVALSVAAIVVAQDRGPISPPPVAEASQMRVRKLPPVGASDPKVDVLRLDHFGQGTVSQARLVQENQGAQAPSEPGKLAPVHNQAMNQSAAAAEIPAEQIEAAKIQAASQSSELSSAMQRDLGVVLAADWSATHKANNSRPRTDIRREAPTTTQNSQQQRQPETANRYPQGGRAPYDRRYQQSNGGSLQDKLNSLRDSITGTQSQPQPSVVNTGRGQNVAPRSALTQQQPTPAAGSSVMRSNAPEAPSIPVRTARSASSNSPRLADPEPESATVKRDPNSLESSRQRRDLSTLSDIATDVAEESDTPSVSVNSSRGAASVISTPIRPAVPALGEEPTVADALADTEEVSTTPQPLTSLKSAEEAAAVKEELASENILLSLEGPQLTAQAVGPRRIVVNQNAEFQVTVKNSGSVDANDVVVSIQLPEWAEVAETGPTRGTTPSLADRDPSTPLLWRINRLEANSSEVLKLNLIPHRSQPLDMSVRWTYAHSGSNTLVEVEEPLLQMVISGPSEAVYGQTKLYNLTLSNPGTGDAHNVVVNLLPLEGKQESAASTKIGTLAHGETKTIQVELSAGKAGMLLVKANATADGGLNAEAAKEVLVRRANLVIEVVAPEAEYAGNSAGYLLRVTNDGNANAEDITVNAVLPEGAEFISSTGDGRFEQKQGRVRWDLGSLAAGQVREVQLSAKLHSPGENRLHTTVQDESDLTAVADVQTAVIARADLKLVVVDPKGPVPVGEDAVYELHILNRGTDKAEAIEAVIFFSEGIEPTSVEGADHEIGRGQVVFKTIPQINANGETVLKITAKADRTGNHVFRAEVLCRSIGTKLAAEETTHYYGRELAAEVSQPVQRTASRPGVNTSRGPAAINNGPSPLPPASIEK